MNSELQIQLDKILGDLAKTDGVDGSLIVDGNGVVLSHHLLQDVDIELFGPMSNVITGSSERLIDSSNHGEIQRVLVESEKGKALFLHLGNVIFIVLMKNDANVGMIMISSKRASQEIIELTKDLKQLEEPEEEIIEITEETTTKTVPEETTAAPIAEETEETITPPVAEETVTPPIAEETVTTPEAEETVEAEEVTTEPMAEESGIVSEETASEEISAPSVEIKGEVQEKEVLSEEVPEAESEIIEEPEEEKPDIGIPVIKPPITFPKLKKVTEIPEDEGERVDLLLKIYESIFLAMSIGASKIMGVAPARGLTRKFLPVEDCKILLNGVDVKNNSTIDFVKIKENADKIPLSEREDIFKESFGKIITIITENYGQVMGYSAFRAMIRPEFKIINESYGHLLDDLGVKKQLHPKLQDLFN